jgi:hypothetical protein
MIIPAHGNEFVYPFSPIYDHNEHCYQNCLVLMFLCFETEGKIYPILFDYWVSEIYSDEDEIYLSKNDIFVKSIEYLLKEGLNIETILFDAAFFNKQILLNLSKFKINIVTRCPKSRVLETNGIKQKAKELFKSTYNGNFYYYHRYQNFLISEFTKVFDLPGQIVAIANNKANLIDRKLFFLFTNNLDLTSPEILRLYKSRWKIESFFKLLKSYLSLSVFYRNGYDYVNERINLALAGFFIIQEISSELKLSFYQALKLFQEKELSDLFQNKFQLCSKYFTSCV